MKYAIDLIPVDIYKKGFVFLVAATLEDITNHFLKLAKVFSAYHLKPVFPFILMLPSILEPTRVLRNLSYS